MKIENDNWIHTLPYAGELIIYTKEEKGGKLNNGYSKG